MSGSGPPAARFRAMAPDDIAAVRDLHAASVEHLSGTHYTDGQIAAYLRSMAADGYADELLANNLTLAETAANRLVGTAGWCPLDDAPDTVRIRKVFVAPDLAGQGLGRQLVQEVERQARSLGFRHAFVRANANAVGFYEALGYAAEGQGAMPVGDGVGLAVTYMRKTLAD